MNVGTIITKSESNKKNVHAGLIIKNTKTNVGIIHCLNAWKKLMKMEIRNAIGDHLNLLNVGVCNIRIMSSLMKM